MDTTPTTPAPAPVTPTKDIFDATLQKVTPHTLEVSSTSGDIIATSVESGHFIKFPGTSTPEEITSLIAEHQTANEGQQNLAEANATLQAIVDAPAPAPVEPTPAPDPVPAPEQPPVTPA